MEKKSDNQLISDYLSGDEKSLEILIKRYLKPIFGFSFRYAGNSQNAEDITQEVFIRVWRNLKKFDKNKKFKTWIFSIAKNTGLDYLKKKKEISFSRFESENGRNYFVENIADPALTADKIFDISNINGKINSAIKKLALQYQTVLRLRYENGFTFKEISEELGEPLNTLKSRCRRALAKLKKILE